MSDAGPQAVDPKPMLMCPVCDAALTGSNLVAGALGLCARCKSLLQVPSRTTAEQREQQVRQWLSEPRVVRTRTGRVLEGLTVGQVLCLVSQGRLARSDMIRTPGAGSFHPICCDERIGPIDWEGGGATAHLDRVASMLGATPATLLYDATSGLTLVRSIPRQSRIRLNQVAPGDVAEAYREQARALLAEMPVYPWPADLADPRAALLQADPVKLRAERERTSQQVAGGGADPLQMDWGAWSPGSASRPQPAQVRFDSPEPVEQDPEVVVEPEPARLPSGGPVSPETLAGLLTADRTQDPKHVAPASRSDDLETVAPKPTPEMVSFDDLVDDFDDDDEADVPEARLVEPITTDDSVADLGESDLAVDADDSDDDLPPTHTARPKP